jgi:hypothetical protein
MKTARQEKFLAETPSEQPTEDTAQAGDAAVSGHQHDGRGPIRIPPAGTGEGVKGVMNGISGRRGNWTIRLYPPPGFKARPDHQSANHGRFCAAAIGDLMTRALSLSVLCARQERT